jgi:hypothetical protein
MEEYERKNKGGEQQIPPKSRYSDPLHIEEILFGENVGLDILSLFPSNRCKNHGRDVEISNSRGSTIGGGGKNKLQRWEPLGKKTPLSRYPKKLTVICRFTRIGSFGHIGR